MDEPNRENRNLKSVRLLPTKTPPNNIIGSDNVSRGETPQCHGKPTILHKEKIGANDGREIRMIKSKIKKNKCKSRRLKG